MQRCAACRLIQDRTNTVKKDESHLYLLNIASVLTKLNSMTAKKSTVLSMYENGYTCCFVTVNSNVHRSIFSLHERN